MVSGSIEKIASELAAATSARKCHACGCFQDAVVALRQTELGSSLSGCLAEAGAVVAERRYDCLGCETCWPANALNSAADVVDLPAGAGCPAAIPESAEGWPPLPGDYRVMRYTAPVAVCTLHSKELIEEVARTVRQGLSIVGSLHTENLGIERVVENVVSNPNLRFLVLCGDDTPGAVGHFPGQSLLALARHGADPRGKIQGARGKRPFLKNLDDDLMEHFREHVEVINVIGVHDISRIACVVEECMERDPGPATRIPRVVRRVPVIRADAAKRVVLDPAGYLVVTPDQRRERIVVEHYDNDGVLRTIVEGNRATDLVATLLREELVTRLDHAAYIGREVTRAEIALRERQPYVQEKAPEGAGQGDAGAGPNKARGIDGGPCSCKGTS